MLDPLAVGIFHFKENGKNYYIVRDTRSKIIKLYDGDKGRELKEQGFKCPCIVELRPPYDWNELRDYLFSLPRYRVEDYIVS